MGTRWEERGIAFLGCLVFGILASAGDKALGEEISMGRYIPPSKSETFCVNYIATLTAVLSTPQGSIQQQLAMRQLEKTDMKQVTSYGVELFKRGESRGDVFPFMYKLCIMLKGGNV